MNIQKSINKIVRERESRKRKYERVRKVLVLFTVLFLGIFIGNIFLQNDFSITGLVTGNLPDVGDSNWGTILNDYLLQEHTTTGAHGNITSNNWTNISITESQINDFKSYRTLDNLTFVGDLNTTGDGNFTGNLTIGEKITFALGEIIDNFVNGWIRINGNLNVVGNLNVSGEMSITGNITDDSGGLISIPSGFIGMFNSTVCPTGWSEMIESKGRYFVSLPTDGTLGATNGTALSDGENRPVGQHNHSITDPGHTHTKGTSTGGAQGGGGSASHNPTTTGSSTTEITIDNEGNVAGTNAPYIQVLVCLKT